MGALFAYSIAAGMIVLVFYIFYKWLLAAENQPRFNRVTLLLIYTAALLLPLMPQLSLFNHGSATDPTGLINIGNATVAFTPDKAESVSVVTLLLWIYATGVAVFAIRTLATIHTLIGCIKSGIKEAHRDFTIVYIDRADLAPFSWGRYIVMNREENDKSASMITTHESAHIRAMHFVDLIISQLVCIFLWYNPASWLMQSELKAVHEYEADERVLQSGCNARDYQLLLIKKAVGQRFPSLANSLNHSKLKKRVTMMYSKKTSHARRTRVLALVPAAALGLALLSVPTVSEAMASTSAAGMSLSSATAGEITTNSSVGQPTSEEVYSSAQKLPQFEGGEKGLIEFLIQNLKYPEDAMKSNEQGNVIVRFVVSDAGEVTDIEVLHPVHPSLDAEAVRVVKATSGKWTPGETDGKKVNVYYTLPITFRTK